MSQTLSLPVTQSGRQQRDLYDLPLSTTPAAAELFRDAQQRLLRVQTAVAAPLRRAVAEDPHFALGHAVLALVGHDLDLSVDTAAHLRAALTSAGRATARERSFVGAVSARLRGAAGHQSRLLQHLAEHPRDALALNMAVPTIAFSGAVEVPEQAWALVEAGLPVFGSDWWYAGLLAFVRQEQGHFDEADVLAGGALASDPAAGHAAHAMAHVFYETGRHGDGLRWIDGWIGDNRATTFQPVALLVARGAARAGARRRDRGAPALRRASWRRRGAGRACPDRLRVAALAGADRRLLARRAADRRRAVGGGRADAGGTADGLRRHALGHRAGRP